MSFSLADIKKNTIGPPRIVIYGVPGIGKTSLAACAQNAAWIPVQDGLAALDVQAFPQPQSYADVLSAVAALHEPNDYDSVILDEITTVEPMLQKHVIAANGEKDIESFGYGKGYIHAATEFDNLLAGFDSLRGMGKQIILLAHSSVDKFEDPERDAYDRYSIALHKRCEAKLTAWADAVLFLNYKVVAVDKQTGDKKNVKKRGAGSGERFIFTQERPAYRAKNRYRMPPSIAIPQDHPEVAWAAIEHAIAASVAAPATTV